MERTYPVTLTSAAEDVLRRAEGAAPPSVDAKACLDCGARGEVFMQVKASESGYVMYVSAPCEHILDMLGLDEGKPAYLVWGGRGGYSVLPLYAAWYMGWRFAQEEAGTVYILGQKDGQVIGLLLKDEAEWLELTSRAHVQCGEEPTLSNTFEFIRERLRVAALDDFVAVFRPLNLLSDDEQQKAAR
jgi:hypothetical protein